MGNDDGCAILHEVFDCVLYKAFGFGVESRCCLVENENRWIFEYCTCYRDALTLTAREARATVANVGLISIRRCYNEIVGVGNASSLFDLGLCSRFYAKGNIVIYGVVEEDSLLVDIAHEVA